jgi:membrane protein implicated in regulation of membrane protease activity
MDMTADTTWWWIASGALVAAELATGTFYLLMLALGTVPRPSPRTWASAHRGRCCAPRWWAAARWPCGICCAAASRRPARPGQSRCQPGHRRTVQVAQWNTDGTARVQYRGASWAARFLGQGEPARAPM